MPLCSTGKTITAQFAAVGETHNHTKPNNRAHSAHNIGSESVLLIAVYVIDDDNSNVRDDDDEKA